MKNNKYKLPNRQLPRPFYFFIITLFAIFVGEYSIMLFLHESDFTATHHGLLDATLLTLMIIPIVYLFLYKPIQEHLNQRLIAEEELKEVNNSLDQIVKARTSELERLNELLKEEHIEKLRLSEEKYKSVVDSLGMGISVISPNMEVIGLNKQMQSWFPEVDVNTRPFCYSVFSPAAKDRMCQDCPTHKALHDGKVYKVTKNAVIDGKNVTHRIIASPIKDKEGNIIAATELVEDISYQLEAEALRLTKDALSENIERYRALVENSSEGIFLVDPYSYGIQEANSKFLAMLGYTSEEITQLNYNDIVLVEPSIFEANLRRLLDRGEVITTFREYKTKNGLTIEVEARASLVNFSNYKVILINVRDLTEQRKGELALRESFERLKITLNETVNALMTVAEKRDPYTAGHQLRVADLASAIAKEMGLSRERIDGLRIAGILHDIGKIYVPADILNKPGRLSEMEMGIIKAHPQTGYEIIEKIPFDTDVAKIVLQHHERINGAGYPHGLVKEDVLIEARILGVADVVEAMASHRPYRPAIGLEPALEEITRNKGIIYDSEVVDACLRLFKEKGFDLDNPRMSA